MRISTNSEFTIYYTRKGNFRIMQTAAKSYAIEKIFEFTKTTGYLWWRKTVKYTKWLRIDIEGDKYIPNIRTYRNYQVFKEYKTFDKAVNWISNHIKYPRLL